MQRQRDPISGPRLAHMNVTRRFCAVISTIVVSLLWPYAKQITRTRSRYKLGISNLVKTPLAKSIEFVMLPNLDMLLHCSLQDRIGAAVVGQCSRDVKHFAGQSAAAGVAA